MVLVWQGPKVPFGSSWQHIVGCGNRVRSGGVVSAIDLTIATNVELLTDWSRVIPALDRRPHRIAAGVFTLALVGGCGPAPPTASPPGAGNDPGVADTARTAGRSGGIIELVEVADSGVSGMLAVTPNDDGSTTLSIELSEASQPYLWRIDRQSVCVPPVTDQEPIWAFPDIENGRQEERIETAAFLSTPGPLFALVLPINGPGILACGDLGPAVSLASNESKTECDDMVGSDSPKPGEVVFTLDRLGNSDIYVGRLDAWDVVRLTTDPGRDFDPAWSPDGRMIAFRSTRDGHDEIYVMNTDGSCQRNLTESDADSWSPAWSPDGRQIAIAHFFDGPSQPQDIAVINVDGSGLERLTTAHGEYPSWSPDGRQLAFASFRDGNYEIYVMNADGSGQQNISRNPAYDMAPSWSPGGLEVAYDTQRDHEQPTQVGIGPEFEIHVMRADGSMDRAITVDDHEDRFPTWLADGRLVWSKEGTVWVADADGGDAHAGGTGTFADLWP